MVDRKADRTYLETFGEVGLVSVRDNLSALNLIILDKDKQVIFDAYFELPSGCFIISEDSAEEIIWYGHGGSLEEAKDYNQPIVYEGD